MWFKNIYIFAYVSVTPAPAAAALLTELLSYLIFTVLFEKSVAIDDRRAACSALVLVLSVCCAHCPMVSCDSQIGGWVGV